MITYRATLDVPVQTVACVSRWLAAHRKTRDARPWQRAATPYAQAVVVLRWFKDAPDLRVLARDSRVSVATAYRYQHEGIDVIAARAPQLSDVLAQGAEQVRSPTSSKASEAVQSCYETTFCRRFPDRRDWHC